MLVCSLNYLPPVPIELKLFGFGSQTAQQISAVADEVEIRVTNRQSKEMDLKQESLKWE